MQRDNHTGGDRYMMHVQAQDLFPQFLLADKNGFAMAKAIERALRIMCDTVQTGIDNVQEVDVMPEWRLDEMAWELGCLYDYGATIEAKRKWIKDATMLFSAFGTPQAIYNYLEGFFERVSVEEHWQYNGEPFHFQVVVSGVWSSETEKWAIKAINAAKNVRSVLDGLRLEVQGEIQLHAETSVIGRGMIPMCGNGILAGQWPQGGTAKRG